MHSAQIFLRRVFRHRMQIAAATLHKRVSLQSIDYATAYLHLAETQNLLIYMSSHIESIS